MNKNKTNVETKAPSENKMSSMPENKLLISISFPIMMSMIVQALYNVVDSLYVARISEDALTAVSMAMPFQNVMISGSAALGVGINALLSKRLGAKEYDEANKAVSNGLFLICSVLFVFMIIGSVIARPFYTSMNAGEDIVNQGVSYLRVVCLGAAGVFAQTTFERLLQSTGKTLFSMTTQATGAILNIILDPIFIFGWFGVPAFGVRGAAIATVIGQCVAGSMALFFNIKFNKEIKITFKKFKPDGDAIKKILSVGVPTFIMQSSVSAMIYGLNRLLTSFTETATAVFGVYFKLQSCIFMPIFGLNNGLIPIVAYNYGAKRRDRVIKTVKIAIAYATSIMLIGVLAFEFATIPLLKMYNASPYMIEIGVVGLKVLALLFIPAGFNMIIGSMFQSLGNGMYTMTVSLIKQVVLVLPLAILFSRIGGLSMLWWAFPIAEIVGFIMTVILLIRINKTVINKI